MTTFWLIALIAFGALEACTAALVSVWFVLGSLAAMIAASLSAPFWLQLLRFILNQDPLNEESWDAFLAKLQDMHAEEMVELKQNAYDRYLSK